MIINITIPESLKIFTNVAQKIDDGVFKTVFYRIALRTALRYHNTVKNMSPIDISSIITGTRDWFLRERAMYAPSVKTEYLEKEFKEESDRAVMELNGWLSYCKKNEDDILRFISMGDEEKYLLPAIEVFLYGNEKSPLYQFHTRIGNETKYLYFT